MKNILSELKTKDSIVWTYIDGISKIAIPVVILFFGWSQNANRQEVETERYKNEMDLKIIQVVWNSLNSGSDHEKENALNLVRVLKSDLAFKMAVLISQDFHQSIEFRKEVADTVLGMASPFLSGFKIDIYYDNNNASDKKRAYYLQERLKKTGYFKDVLIFPREKNTFFAEVMPSYGYEIRYEWSEREESEILESIMNVLIPDAQFSRRLIFGKSTPKMISVFLFSL
jgi:hypothetical protein